MATLAAYYESVTSHPFLKGFFEVNQPVAAKRPADPASSAVFLHALAAVSAKLAAVDGQVNKAEYQAFATLFGGNDESRMRGLFLKHVEDSSSPLQYARQLAAMTVGDEKLHHELLERLVAIAAADATLNAGEMELLRAIADILGVSRETFRMLIGAQLVPATSPYATLGVSSHISDEALRAHYMAQVQKLHPDRYLAAGASADTVAMLSDQLAALNAAYQDIRARRGKKGVFTRAKYTKSAKAVAA